jgi:hypothetical protein
VPECETIDFQEEIEFAPGTASTPEAADPVETALELDRCASVRFAKPGLDGRPLHRRENLPQAIENLQSAPGIAHVPEAADPAESDVFNANQVRLFEERPLCSSSTAARDDGKGGTASERDLPFASLAESAPNDRRENPPQFIEKIESTPGIATAPEASDGAEAADPADRAFQRPEPGCEPPALDAPGNDRP